MCVVDMPGDSETVEELRIDLRMVGWSDEGLLRRGCGFERDRKKIAVSEEDLQVEPAESRSIVSEVR